MLKMRNVILVQPLDSHMVLHISRRALAQELMVNSKTVAHIYQRGVLLMVGYGGNRNCDIVTPSGNVLGGGEETTIPFEGGLTAIKLADDSIQVLVLRDALSAEL